MAAVIVVIRHTFNALALPTETRLALLHSPAAIVLNAQGAVQLFFVLSGYVLAASLARGTGAVDLLQFYVKRWFRIQPPYIFGLLCAWVASGFYPADATTGMSALFQRFASIHLAPLDVLRFALFPGDAALQFPVGWTLRVEMLFSLLLPGLVLLARLHWVVLLIASVGVLAYSSFQSPFGYAIDFAVGIVIFRQRVELARACGRLSAIVRGIAFAGAVALFTLPVYAGAETVVEGVVVSGFQGWEIAVMAIGGGGLVVAALQPSSVSRLLASRPSVWLGKISYSLYLLHFTVLLVGVHFVGAPVGWAQGMALLLMVLGVTIPVSALSHRAVELPAIRAGNSLCQWITRKRSIPVRASRLVEASEAD